MYKCRSCFGPEVEALQWVDLNSSEVMDSDEVGEFYCRSCGSHVEVFYEQGAYEEPTVTKDKENEEID